MDTSKQLHHLKTVETIASSKRVLKTVPSFFAQKINKIIELTDSLVLSKVWKYLPAAIFGTSIAVSSVLWKLEFNSTTRDIEKLLDSQLLDITYPIQARFQAYEQILYGVHGLYDSSKDVTREEFQSYVKSLKLPKNYPEIPGISVSKYVPGKKIQSHISELKEEGFPQYGTKIVPWKSEYAPVIYIEPFEWKNINAFGFDNFSDETRKALLRESQEGFQPMLSEPIYLKQDNGKSTNMWFLLTYPLYGKLYTHETYQDRQKNIYWWGSLVFRLDDLINNVTQKHLSQLSVRIYDGDDLLFSSFDEKPGSKFDIKRTKEITLSNRTWTFEIYSSALQEASTHHKGYLDNIFYSWIFVTLLLTLLSHGFIRTRLEAKRHLEEQELSILQLEQMSTDLKTRATHDALTGLPNRVGFLEKLEALLSLAHRNDEKVAFMFIDLDKFKYVNDTFGHQVWDALLVQVADKIKHILRAEDIVGRQGWDEFFVAIGNFHDIEIPAKVAGKIMKALEKPFYIDGYEIYIGSSIGISMYPDDSTLLEDLQKYADMAMYSVKWNGRNGYHFYTESMQKDAEEYSHISNALRNAIENQEFSMVYQPIIDMTSGKVTSMESLIRWNNPELGAVSPAKFIPIAESDLQNIDAIGKWTLEAVCKQINLWKNKNYYIPRVAVNISAKQFLSKDFEIELLEILRKHDVSPHFIGLEITEGSLFKDIDAAVDIVERLSQRWFTILIDDFGTWYSNLHYISKFSAGIIKIDKSFIGGIEHQEQKQIITLIITLAHSLGMQVVAEWVETQSQYAQLQTLGCDFVQGYLTWRPVKPGEVEVHLLRNDDDHMIQA